LRTGYADFRPIAEQRKGLPIFQYKDRLRHAVDTHDVLVLIGETGCGKTTQLPQYLAEWGYADNGVVACTQPRRIAATSVAERVAQEVGCRLGREVGYSIRFDDRTTPGVTKLRYMTDGMLLREALGDPGMGRYSCVIVDEAHERSVSTDVLMGLLRDVLAARRRTGPPFKLIVTSATLDAGKFSEYFFGAPLFRIPGRAFPVELLHASEAAVDPDYLGRALDTVCQIHLSERLNAPPAIEGAASTDLVGSAPCGDVLLFLTGQDEIEVACEMLEARLRLLRQRDRSVPPLLPLPVFSALPSETQTRIFEPAEHGTRKCVIATNIAETSLTIDGISYVVDPGFAKLNVFNPKLGMDSLVVMPISQAAADQRAGRAGRTGPGRCYRLYSQACYDTEMLPATPPEIQRVNLTATALTLRAMGIRDVLAFPFMDPPPRASLVEALRRLALLQALDSEGVLTRSGRLMSLFPVDPSLSRAVLASCQLHCGREMLQLAGLLSVPTVFYRPRAKAAEASRRQERFSSALGDHVTLLNVRRAWLDQGRDANWCSANFLQSRALARAEDVATQLTHLVQRAGLPVESCGSDFSRLLKALIAGFFLHVCKRGPPPARRRTATAGPTSAPLYEAGIGCYHSLVDGQTVYMFPGSALFRSSPEYVLYNNLTLTQRPYMRICAAVKSQWLVQQAPQVFQRAALDASGLSAAQKVVAIEPLSTNREWRVSRQRTALQRNGGR
jgi:ATP-dependent RNA helicase DHX8/PRP22